MRKPLRVVVLISGTGRNLQALIDTCADDDVDAQIVGVISNRPGAAGLQRATDAGIPATTIDHTEFESRAAFDIALAAAIEQFEADVILLAGFMRILTPDFIAQFAGRMLNIHPSLLPKYRGLNTYARAIEAGDTEAGASVHFVTAELDGGPVVLQGRCPVQADDTPEILAERVMREVELRIYPQVLRWLAQGRLQPAARGFLFDGVEHLAPLQVEAV
ncbi:phosphoribosylglycinamide formyltransferase [bacterium]|nr:phosphoribosylglycinamide formyltransferase [bacterium]